MLYYNIIMFACRPCRRVVVFGLNLERGASDMRFVKNAHVAHVAEKAFFVDFHGVLHGLVFFLWIFVVFLMNTHMHRVQASAGRRAGLMFLFPAKLSRKCYDSFPAKGQQTNCDRPAFADT